MKRNYMELIMEWLEGLSEERCRMVYYLIIGFGK